MVIILNNSIHNLKTILINNLSLQKTKTNNINYQITLFFYKIFKSKTKHLIFFPDILFILSL